MEFKSTLESTRKPLLTESLTLLRDLGIQTNWILDVGVQTCTESLIKVFKDKHHVLVEPLQTWNESINRVYGTCGVDYSIVNKAASDFVGTALMEVSSVNPEYEVTHANLISHEISENALDPDKQNTRSVNVTTVAELVVETGRPGPFLLKVDVDGVEDNILRGAIPVSHQISILIVEANTRNLTSRLRLADDMGMQLFDLTDLCYYDGKLRQFDCVFVNRELAERHSVNFSSSEFDIARWTSYKP